MTRVAKSWAKLDFTFEFTSSSPATVSNGRGVYVLDDADLSGSSVGFWVVLRDDQTFDITTEDGDDYIDRSYPGYERDSTDHDIVNAGGGNDLIDVGYGNDIIDGGAGDGDMVILVYRDTDKTNQDNAVIIDVTDTARYARDDDNMFTASNSGLYQKFEYTLFDGTVETDYIANVERFYIRTGSGNDVLTGGDSGDQFHGGKGNDTLNGGGGNDILRASYGNDTLNGGTGNDFLSGGGGNDTLNGGAGNDKLKGGNRKDILNGDAGNDTLLGGKHNDTLDGGAGVDRLTGGVGDDIFVLANSSANLDHVSDFRANGADDKIRVDVADPSAIATLTQLYTVANITTDARNGRNLGGVTTTSTNDGNFLDVGIHVNSAVVMVLEDFAVADLTFEMFELV